MVGVREKQTDWKSIIRDFFASSEKSLKKEEESVNKWRADNAETISVSENNIMKLEKMLLCQSKKGKRQSSTKQRLKAEPIKTIQNNNMQTKEDNRERE